MDVEKLEFEVHQMKLELAVIQHRIEREMYALSNLGFHTFRLKIRKHSTLYLTCYDAANNSQEYAYPDDFEKCKGG